MQRETPVQVVLADPNARDRERIKRLTSMYTAGRYEFREAATGEETLHLIGACPTDCLLLSDPLPDMKAAQVVSSIHRERAPLPTIVFGDQSDPAAAADALQAGAASYLEKRELTAHAISSAMQDAFAHADLLRLQHEEHERAARQRERDEAQEQRRQEEERKQLVAVQEQHRRGLTMLDVPLQWSLGGRWRDASVCDLSTLGARIEDVGALPPEGSILELSMQLLEGVAPLRLRAEVIRPTESGGFEVAFVRIGRRDKILLRNAASRARRATKNKPS